MTKYLISYGLSNVNVYVNDTLYPLIGAVELEFSLPTDDYESCRICGNDIEVRFSKHSVAEGSITLLYLSEELREVLFGTKRDKKGGIVGTINEDSPIMALTFEQMLSDGRTSYTTFYNVRFNKPNNISARTLSDSFDYENITLEFDCYYNSNYNSYFYTITSNEVTNHSGMPLYPEY